ncbi:MAG: monovalent cation/H(+) antiporter subunit G [Planctomycetota bacterium]
MTAWETLTAVATWLNHALTAGLVIVGGLFSLLAAVGLLRMPDVYTRMQAATKAGTLGVGCIILAVATHFLTLGVVLESILVIGMLFITAPVASHLIARAAYFVDDEMWDGTAYDEMRGCYDATTHVLHSTNREERDAGQDAADTPGDPTVRMPEAAREPGRDTPPPSQAAG